MYKLNEWAWQQIIKTEGRISEFEHRTIKSTQNKQQGEKWTEYQGCMRLLKKKKDMLFKSLEPQKKKRQESSAKNSNGLADLAKF